MPAFLIVPLIVHLFSGNDGQTTPYSPKQLWSCSVTGARSLSWQDGWLVVHGDSSIRLISPRNGSVVLTLASVHSAVVSNGLVLAARHVGDEAFYLTNS